MRSDQQRDVKQYDEMLGEDFTATLPGPLFLDNGQFRFLEMMAKPRPFTELRCENVSIGLLGDFALVYARMSFRGLDGKIYEGRYTDDW